MMRPLPTRGGTALIIRNAYTFDFGGGERFPVLLALELQKHGYEPVIVSRSARLLSHAQDKGLSTVKGWWWSHQNFSGKNILLFPLYAVWQFLLFSWYIQLILRTHAAVVHPQSRDDFIAATLAGRLLKRRVVWTDHADLKYIWQNHLAIYKNLVGKLVYLASKAADAICLVSYSEKKLIEEQLHYQLPAKFTVIHNGINPYPVSAPQRDEADKDAVIFVATSRLVTAKGIGELIDAFKQIDAKSNLRLWLIGDGPEAKAFQDLAKDNGHILFLGYRDKPLQLIMAADIFVHPSYHEGFSISLVEAAMLGKPIIACNVGGNPEIVKDSVNGRLVPPHDSKSLRAAMLGLALDKSLRKRYGKRAREIYADGFVLKKLVTEKYIPLYEK